MRSLNVSALFLAATLALVPLTGAAQAAEDSAVTFMRSSSTPVDYLVSRFKSHRVVLIGEPHWVKHDVQLLSALVPRLLDANVTTFAAEWIPAREQQRVDAIVASDSWNESEAVAVLRAGAWPYREYLEVLHDAWRANKSRRPDQSKLRVIGLSPDVNWREQLLPLGKTYDSFMAEQVARVLDASPANRALVALGFHHAFTRYVQPDLPSGNRATRFNDRMGNILWRGYGEDVFMVAMHHPWYCRSGKTWGRCLPLDGAVDCAAVAAGNGSVGFDVAGSPFAAMRINSDVWYAAGSPFLRFDAFADGYIWTQPIERYESVSLIPLDTYAPDAKSLAEALANNPVSDVAANSREALEGQWSERAAELRNILANRRWETVVGWRRQCAGFSKENHGTLSKV